MKISNEIIEDIKEKPNQFTSVVGVSSNLYFLGMANVSQLFLLPMQRFYLWHKVSNPYKLFDSFKCFNLSIEQNVVIQTFK